MEEIGQGFGNIVTALCVSAFTVKSAIQGNEDLKDCYVEARKTTKETVGHVSGYPEYTDVLDKINNAGAILCKVEQTPNLDSLISALSTKEHTYAIVLVQAEANILDNTRWDKVLGVIGDDGVNPNYTFIDSSEGCAFTFTDLNFDARTYLSSFKDASFTMIRIQLVPHPPTPKKKKPVSKKRAPVVKVEEEVEVEEEKPEKKKPKVVKKRTVKKVKEEA